MKKTTVTLAWASGAIGILLIILGIIARLAGGILLNHWWSNYFYPGAVFVILGIFFFLGTMAVSRDDR